MGRNKKDFRKAQPEQPVFEPIFKPGSFPERYMSYFILFGTRNNTNLCIIETFKFKSHMQVNAKIN
jgi:hypothetical protein